MPSSPFYRLSRQADTDLKNIYRYTRDHWGAALCQPVAAMFDHAGRAPPGRTLA